MGCIRLALVSILVFGLACGADEPAPGKQPAAKPPVHAGAEAQDAKHPLGAHLVEQYHGGLPEILEQRYIRVLTSKNSFDYYIHRGKPGGLQYEMVRAFVKHLNKKYKTEDGQLRIQFR